MNIAVKTSTISSLYPRLHFNSLVYRHVWGLKDIAGSSSFSPLISKIKQDTEFSSVLCDYLDGWDVGQVAGRSQRKGIYLYVWLIHFVVQQKLTQHCKAIILQRGPGRKQMYSVADFSNHYCSSILPKEIIIFYRLMIQIHHL